MRKKSKILLLTLVMLFLIPISCRIDEIQRVPNHNSEFILEARQAFYANQIALGKFSKISNELNWSKSFFSSGKDKVVVEVPFELKQEIKSQNKINNLVNEDFTNFNRILLKLKDGKWSIFHIVISTKIKNFDINDSKFNYYHLNQNFNGFITSYNFDTNEITTRKYHNSKIQHQENVLAREDDETFCTFFGQFNEDG